MSLLTFLLKNKLLFAAIIAIPLLIYFLVLNDRAQRQFSRSPVTQQQVTNTQPEAQNTTDITGTPESPQDRSLDKIEHRIPLTQDDFYARSNILKKLPPEESSGIVYETQKVVVEYIASADTFQAEIVTADVAAAKSEAATWFQSQGMSQDGICNIPLSFYLNYDIKNELGPDADSFNPLPDGC